MITRCLVSSLDETLFRTKIAVTLAYERAGVDAVTFEVNWGRPWQSWVGIAEHSRKCEIYREYTATPLCTPKTSAYDVASHLLNQHKAYVSVLTSASHEAATSLLEREGGATAPRLLGWSMDVRQKMLALASVVKRYDEVVYLDDDAAATLWIPNEVRFIQYTGQDYDTLMTEIGWL